MNNVSSDVICAISTPVGSGGVALLRVSGKEAIALVEPLVRLANRQPLSAQSARSIHFATIMAGQTVIDEALISLFRAPHSYTGEDMVEISCHGSVYIQQTIMQLFIDLGARQAHAGEFTKRAFLNGKMDLAQAEAVADLIASESAAAHRMAVNQMRGGFSEELTDLRTQLLHFVSLIELELDFTEEDVEFVDRLRLKDLAVAIAVKVNRLADSFRWGNVLKNGVPVALVGETNVGKSTLLNVLLNEEKAIVSDIHGTTRDAIEDTVNIQGITFRFIDTAGIRNTSDIVENLGIERTYQKIEQAAIVLWLVDGTQVSEHIEWLTERIMKRGTGKKIILLFNKIDRLTEEELTILDNLFTPYPIERIRISAKKQRYISKLKTALVRAVDLDVQANDVIVSNIRHYQALKAASVAINRVVNGIEENLSGELLSRDIRECMHYLGEITGEITTDEVLGNIFGNFCVGK